MSQSGYIMKVEIFVPFDAKDPASVAAASTFAATKFLTIENASDGCTAETVSSRMVMNRKTKSEPETVTVERVEEPTHIEGIPPSDRPDDAHEIPGFLKRTA